MHTQEKMQSKDLKVEVAIEYAGSVISSFGTNGVPNGISAIKEMIASGFKSGAEWRSKQSPWIKNKRWATGCR